MKLEDVEINKVYQMTEEEADGRRVYIRAGALVKVLKKYEGSSVSNDIQVKNISEVGETWYTNASKLALTPITSKEEVVVGKLYQVIADEISGEGRTTYLNAGAFVRVESKSFSSESTSVNVQDISRYGIYRDGNWNTAFYNLRPLPEEGKVYRMGRAEETVIKKGALVRILPYDKDLSQLPVDGAGHDIQVQDLSAGCVLSGKWWTKIDALDEALPSRYEQIKGLPIEKVAELFIYPIDFRTFTGYTSKHLSIIIKNEQEAITAEVKYLLKEEEI